MSLVMTPAQQQRFWSGVDTSGDCWLWLRKIHAKTGYGSLHVGGKAWLAHRVAFLLSGREIESGLQLDHLCRVRRCVRPDHLEPVTCRENLLRSPLTFQARNAAKTHCPRGHALSEGFTYTDKFGTAHRRCTVCQRDHSRIGQSRRRAVARALRSDERRSSPHRIPSGKH